MQFFNKGDPDYINDKGIKWWQQKINWGYERNLPQRLRELNVQWFYIEFPSDEKAHVVVKNGEVIKEFKGLEDVGVFLDVLPIALEDDTIDTK